MLRFKLLGIRFGPGLRALGPVLLILGLGDLRIVESNGADFFGHELFLPPGRPKGRPPVLDLLSASPAGRLMGYFLSGPPPPRTAPSPRW